MPEQGLILSRPGARQRPVVIGKVAAPDTQRLVAGLLSHTQSAARGRGSMRMGMATKLQPRRSIFDYLVAHPIATSHLPYSIAGTATAASVASLDRR